MRYHEITSCYPVLLREFDNRTQTLALMILWGHWLKTDGLCGDWEIIFTEQWQHWFGNLQKHKASFTLEISKRNFLVILWSRDNRKKKDSSDQGRSSSILNLKFKLTKRVSSCTFQQLCWWGLSSSCLQSDRQDVGKSMLSCPDVHN